MGYAITHFAISAFVIIIAGSYLSKFADEIAERTGFGRLLIGSILLAGATSLPELSVDISAVRSGITDLAVGDLMGSCLFNLLILAILDLSRHSRGKMLSRQAARHALSGNVSCALLAVITLCFLSPSVLGANQYLGISLGLWLILFGYVLGVRMVYLDQEASRRESSQSPTESEIKKEGILRPALGFIAAAGVIVVGGPFLASAAGSIAELSGLGKSFVGSTLVAFSTSLPELVASLAAIRLGAHDLAIGNIFGSNVFNVVLLVPLDLFHEGPLLGGLSSGHAVTSVGAILATMIVVLGQLYQVETRKRFIEPDAWLVISVIFGSLWLVYLTGH